MQLTFHQLGLWKGFTKRGDMWKTGKELFSMIGMQNRLEKLLIRSQSFLGIAMEKKNIHIERWVEIIATMLARSRYLFFILLLGNFLYYFVPHRHMNDVPVLGAIYLKSKST